MAQATNPSTTSRFHNLSNAALADALGHADAVLKGAEAECKALKDEIKRRGLLEAAGNSFEIRADPGLQAVCIITVSLTGRTLPLARSRAILYAGHSVILITFVAKSAMFVMALRSVLARSSVSTRSVQYFPTFLRDCRQFARGGENERCAVFEAIRYRFPRHFISPTVWGSRKYQEDIQWRRTLPNHQRLPLPVGGKLSDLRGFRRRYRHLLDQHVENLQLKDFQGRIKMAASATSSGSRRRDDPPMPPLGFGCFADACREPCIRNS